MISLQLYTIVFAAALAFLNRIPCVKMADRGASIREEKEFHKENAAVKIIVAYWKASFISYEWPFHFSINWHLLLVFVLMLLIMWVVFDCVLGKLLHNNWWYLGETAKLDNLLVNGIRIRKPKYNSIGLIVEPEKRILGLGEYAGEVKFLIACTIILFINFYL